MRCKLGIDLKAITYGSELYSRSILLLVYKVVPPPPSDLFSVCVQLLQNAIVHYKTMSDL